MRIKLASVQQNLMSNFRPKLSSYNLLFRPSNNTYCWHFSWKFRPNKCTQYYSSLPLTLLNENTTVVDYRTVSVPESQLAYFTGHESSYTNALTHSNMILHVGLAIFRSVCVNSHNNITTAYRNYINLKNWQEINKKFV